MTELESRVRDNVARVRDRMAAAAVRSGRNPEDVTLVAVTKMQPAEAVAAVLAAGVLDVGENYVPEAEAKFREVVFPAGARRHLIGHLQSNKARRALDCFDMVQSVDSLRIATRINTVAAEKGIVVPVLMEVKLSDEPDKTGFLPEALSDALEEILTLSNLRVEGLMGMAPFTDDETAVRSAFRTLEKHFSSLHNESKRVLSMGMTGDFETAIEEGSTMVRIGTALFGPRTA